MHASDHRGGVGRILRSNCFPARYIVNNVNENLPLEGEEIYNERAFGEVNLSQYVFFFFLLVNEIVF